jgi:hypothetical protein
MARFLAVKQLQLLISNHQVWLENGYMWQIHSTAFRHNLGLHPDPGMFFRAVTEQPRILQQIERILADLPAPSPDKAQYNEEKSWEIVHEGRLHR